MRFPHAGARHGRTVALLSLLVLLPTSSFAATIVIDSSNQDAFVQKNLPNRITGASNKRLRVEAAPLNTKVKRALVQFPLGAIPAGSVVTAAVVELYAAVNAANPTLRHGLHRITSPWSETEVKWNNAPEFVDTASATALVGDGRGFKAFDVTPDVQAAINLCSNDHGWLVKDVAETGSNDDVAYIAREEVHPSDIVNRPHLTVTFTPPACVTDADCQDTNLCTTAERCIAGACVADPVGCDDGNPCTNDVCDCGQGCRIDSICNDGLSCTTDICDPTTLECSYTKSDAVCVTACSTGTCLGDPDDPTIEPDTGCFIESTEPTGTSCSDGEQCTTPDTCDGSGTCVPGPKDCDQPGCGTSPVCQEQCDNCIDDDEDGLIDQRDPQCPTANGAGAGLGDPRFRGKRLMKCQQGIRAAGSRFANQLRLSLEKCTQGVFACLQQKPGDTACLDKARSRCAKQTAALQGGASSLEGRLAKKISKLCGSAKPGFLPVVAGADLCDEKGLGFESAVTTCKTPQSPGLMAAVIGTLADAHRCHTVQLFATDIPRAEELLALGGVDTSALPCRPTDGAQGGNVGLGKPAAILKAVVSCQRAIGTAGMRFVKQILEAEQRCTEAVAKCLQTKPDDRQCLGKAQRLCRKQTGKLYEGPSSRESKLKSNIARACGTAPGKAPRLAIDDLRSARGLGYDTLLDDCFAYGVGGLSSLDEVSECLVRHNVCRADQLLMSRTPRARELLAIGGAVAFPRR